MPHHVASDQRLHCFSGLSAVMFRINMVLWVWLYAHLACLVKNPADDIFKYFFLIFRRQQTLTFYANCLLRKNKKISSTRHLLNLSREYSRLSLSRSSRDPLKHFEISIPRHIRFSELRKTIHRTTKFNKWICNLAPEVRDIIKILWKRGEIAP